MSRSLVCSSCSVSFEFTDEDEADLVLCAPSLGEQRLAIAPPKNCPTCRQQQRLIFRNDLFLYQNVCGHCSKAIVSIYPKELAGTVLCKECFWSDAWNARDYGRDFDFSRPFFEQFAELKMSVPRLGLFFTHSENSDFTVHSTKNKNCYLTTSVHECENVYYSDSLRNCRDCCDMFACHRMELCYECCHSYECFNSAYLENCTGLSDSSWCFDCKGGSNLVGCVGLRNGSNSIFNKRATPEECKAVTERLNKDPLLRQRFLNEYRALRAAHPRPESWSWNVEDSSGNYLRNSSFVRNCFNLNSSAQCSHSSEGNFCVSCVDCTRPAQSEFVYNSAAHVHLSYSAFCNLCYDSSYLLYCDNCQAGCDSCFGCMSLTRAHHCILNKEYSPQDYERTVSKIVAHMRETDEWGEFFPEHLSFFAYNRSRAGCRFPLSRQEVQKRGWRWEEDKKQSLEGVKTHRLGNPVLATDPEAERIVQGAIICEATGKAFRITTPEFAFYKKKGLPLPSEAPAVRMTRRMNLENWPSMQERQCSKCKKAIQTAYPRQSELQVYCESCYLAYTFS